MIGALGEVAYAGFAPHNPLSPVNTVASAHVAMASPNFTCLEWVVDAPLWTMDVLGEPLEIEDATLTLPRRAGPRNRARPRRLPRAPVPTDRPSGVPTRRRRCGRLVSVAASGELARASGCLREHALDFVLLATPPNVTYVSGFEASLQAGYTAELSGWLPSLAIVGSDGTGCLVVADTEAAAARGQTWLDDVFEYEALGHFAPSDAGLGFADALRAALTALGLTRGKAALGVEPALPHVARAILADACAHADVGDATAALDEARRIKSPREIGLLRGAIAIADAGQRQLLEIATRDERMTDVALWANVVATMQTEAGRPVPVVGGLVTGMRTAVLTSPGPCGATVEPGDLALLDIGPRVSGYWADCCNTVVIGAEPNAEQQRYLRATREACEAAIAELRPGSSCSGVAVAVKTTLERHGLTMAHYAGHQIGAGVNEPPRLLPYNETPIEAGMVFAIEAGAYAGADGTVGARSEKVALVTESGPEILSAFPWQR